MNARGKYIGETEKNYIEASASLQEQRQRERERRRRLIIGGLVIGLLIAIVLSIYAFSQRSIAEQNVTLADQNAATVQAEVIARSTQQRRAEEEAETRSTQQAIADSERIRAEEESQARATQQSIAENQARVAFSRELAAAAVNNLVNDPELSILLALEGLNNDQTQEAVSALHRAIQASSIRKTFVNEETGSFWLTASPDGESLFLGLGVVRCGISNQARLFLLILSLKVIGSITQPLLLMETFYFYQEKHMELMRKGSP